MPAVLQARLRVVQPDLQNTKWMIFLLRLISKSCSAEYDEVKKPQLARSLWAALSLVKSEIHLYDSHCDSLFSLASSFGDLELLAQLVNTKSHLSTNNMPECMYTSKLGQVIVLCLEFSVAVTCLLFDGDPKTVVLDQKELCLHFIKIMETNLIAQFPT